MRILAIVWEKFKTILHRVRTLIEAAVLTTEQLIELIRLAARLGVVIGVLLAMWGAAAVVDLAPTPKEGLTKVLERDREPQRIEVSLADLPDEFEVNWNVHVDRLSINPEAVTFKNDDVTIHYHEEGAESP